MKICIVSLNIVPYFHAQNGAQYGGAEVQAGVLAEALQARGAGIVLAVADRGEPLALPSENAFSSRDGIPGTRFFYPRLSGILDALRRADADVYYQRNAGMVTGLTAWFCRRYDRVFVYGAGSDTDFSSREVRIEGWRDRFLYFYGLKRADGIVVQNAAQAVACRDRLQREPLVIPNAIAVSEDDAPTKERVVVWVGALRDIKQPSLFVDLARQLPDIDFVIIGGDVASERATARRVTTEAFHVPNLKMAGRLGRDAVDDYLRRAALLVNTSRVEGFPNAFLEAWRRGTPVLSFVDVDGLIARESVGAVCADLDDMVAKTRELVDDASQRVAMGARARKLVTENYSADAIAPRYLRYFEELMAMRTATTI